MFKSFIKRLMRRFTSPVKVSVKLVNTKVMSELDLSKIKSVDFPTDQYKASVKDKKQIYIHHTVSGDGVIGDINWWKTTPEDVATCVIIDRNGDIYQCFSSKYWAHHLGIKSTVFKSLDLTSINTKLNQESIGIEIDSWGGLEKNTAGQWVSYTGKVVPTDNVTEYPEGFRGYYGFEKYTEEQIEATRQLLKYWGGHYKIPLDYKGDALWDISKEALSGEEGVWTHVSVRPDKSDCHPQPELVQMLKGL
jgi:N-acetyl-anhydromuramyl-L-alanine amidase AmpD